MSDPPAPPAPPEAKRKKRAERRRYVREYLRWLLPHRQAVGGFMLLALAVAGLQMIEPLFQRNIVDKVLLNTTLDYTARITRLNLTGAVFVGVIVASNLVGAWKDYRQRLLNTRVMLSLRRELFDRLLNLPLPQLWERKTGGILSRSCRGSCSSASSRRSASGRSTARCARNCSRSVVKWRSGRRGDC